MSGNCLKFDNPIGDAISRIRFAPQSNNLLISSWDSSLRLYDVDSSLLRLESPSEAALLDCCFKDESVAFSAGSDGFIRSYDFHVGISNIVGNHDDIATCVGYSDETGQLVTTSLDKKMMFWDSRQSKALLFSRALHSEVGSMTLFGFDLIVAVGASVNLYDLRNLDRSVQSSEPRVDVQIRCISPIPYSRGYAVGSVDGRVALEISYPSNSNNMGYIFRCHPKSKDGKYHLAPVNDIGFNPLHWGAFVTGDNEGHVIAWDAQSRRRLFELPRFPNSIASLSYSHGGELLAIASSYTYQEAAEIEDPPQIFIHKMDRSVSAGSSK